MNINYKSVTGVQLDQVNEDGSSEESEDCSSENENSSNEEEEENGHGFIDSHRPRDESPNSKKVRSYDVLLSRWFHTKTEVP